RSLQLLVVGVQTPERNLQRLAREDEREKREHVREALAGARAHELIERREAVGGVDAVEQAPALPDAAADRDLAEHDGEDLLLVDLHARVLLDDRRQRAGRLVSD